MIEQPPARARHAAARSALILDETTRERESFVSRLCPHKLRLAAVLWRLPLVVFYMRAAAVYSCCSTAPFMHGAHWRTRDPRRAAPSVSSPALSLSRSLQRRRRAPGSETRGQGDEGFVPMHVPKAGDGSRSPLPSCIMVGSACLSGLCQAKGQLSLAISPTPAPVQYSTIPEAFPYL